MLGAGVTVNVDPLLACPPTVTNTGPVVAPVGTGAVIEVALQAVGVEAIPLKLTVLLACMLRKLVPAITTEVCNRPCAGRKTGDRGCRRGPAAGPRSNQNCRSAFLPYPVRR